MGSERLRPAQRAALAGMGITRWMLRDGAARAPGAEAAVAGAPAAAGASAPAPCAVPPAGVVEAAQGPAGGQGGGVPALAVLRAEVASCTRCVLHATRTQTVFGVGTDSPRWLVVGEAPGADEDAQGEPFVGRAGKLLDEMLLAAGVRREQVYIANILKCRPPANRDPRPEESDACEPWLQQQIALLRPGLILAVGRIAAQRLLRDEAPLSRLRGRVHVHAPSHTPLVVTYHPAYLLRSPGQKRRAWEDLCLARAQVAPWGRTA